MNRDRRLGLADTRHKSMQAFLVPRPVGMLFCVGISHVLRQQPQLIDMGATAGPTRVGYMEDGVVLCASCVYELDLTYIG